MSEHYLRTLVAIIASIVIYGLTLGFTSPLLSIILEMRGIDRSWIGLNATMPSLALISFSAFIPALVARYGMKNLLIFCLAGDLVLIMLLPVFDGLLAWFVIRFLMGVCIGALFIISETWINSIASDVSRGKIIAVYSSAFYFTMALGPSMIPLTGVSGYFPFLIAGSLIIVASIPLFWATDVKQIYSEKTTSIKLWDFMVSSPVLAISASLFALLEFTLISLLPIYSLRNGASQASAAFALTAVGMGRVILQVPIGWLADKYDRFRILTSCIALTCVGSVFMPWAVTAGMPGYILMFLWGSVFGGIYTVVITMVGSRYKGHDLVVVNASIGLLWGLGGIAGPAVTGIMMDIIDPHGFIIVLTATTAIALFYILLHRKLRN